MDPFSIDGYAPKSLRVVIQQHWVISLSILRSTWMTFDLIRLIPVGYSHIAHHKYLSSVWIILDQQLPFPSFYLRVSRRLEAMTFIEGLNNLPYLPKLGW